MDDLRAALTEIADMLPGSVPLPMTEEEYLRSMLHEAVMTARRALAATPEPTLDAERLARALPCEDPEEPCDADGRDEHRWCDYCIARSVIRRPAIAAEYARLNERTET